MKKIENLSSKELSEIITQLYKNEKIVKKYLDFYLNPELENLKKTYLKQLIKISKSKKITLFKNLFNEIQYFIQEENTYIDFIYYLFSNYTFDRNLKYNKTNMYMYGIINQTLEKSKDNNYKTNELKNILDNIK
jgi:hypothetical protein